MKFLKDLVQAAIVALLFGGPMFIYLLFVMKP